MFRIKVECVLNKSIDKVFDAITDHGNYKKFPGIDDSILVEKGKSERNGEGALRIISAKPFQLTERIIHFEKPFCMKYHIEASSPIRMRHDKGEVTMQAVGDKTKVLWISEGHMDIPIVGHVFDKVVELKISRAFRAILKHIEEN